MPAEYIYHVKASSVNEILVRLTEKGEHDMEQKPTSFLLNFIIRAILGMGLIYFINQYMIPNENAWKVGLNAVSFLTSGTLGIPGVCLLYGILIYQNL